MVTGTFAPRTFTFRLVNSDEPVQLDALTLSHEHCVSELIANALIVTTPERTLIPS